MLEALNYLVVNIIWTAQLVHNILLCGVPFREAEDHGLLNLHLVNTFIQI